MEHNWEELYQSKDTGWDIGYPSTPLKTYIDQIQNKQLQILIPGCGNAHEAEYLHKSGFVNTHIIDIAPSAIANFKERVSNFPSDKIFCSDFFKFEGQFDLIMEQTFFCAIHPSKRQAYANKMHELLSEQGILVGLLFDDVLNVDHPPYGGNAEEYTSIFSPLFTIKTMEKAHNSIEPRKARELFIILEKK